MGTPKTNYWPNIKNLPDFKSTFPKWEKQPLKNSLPHISAKGI